MTRITGRGTRARGARVWLVAIAIGVGAGEARADDPPPATSAPATTPVAGITLNAAPIFGTDAASGNGWNEVVARIDNPSGAPQKGVRAGNGDELRLG